MVKVAGLRIPLPDATEPSGWKAVIVTETSPEVGFPTAIPLKMFASELTRGNVRTLWATPGTAIARSTPIRKRDRTKVLFGAAIMPKPINGVDNLADAGCSVKLKKRRICAGL
jgi:hypothetical protein